MLPDGYAAEQWQGEQIDASRIADDCGRPGEDSPKCSSPHRNEDSESEDEVGATCLGYTNAEPTEPAFELSTAELERSSKLVSEEMQRREKLRREIEDASGEIALAALANDNRNFITVSVNGAVLSLAGPGLAHRHADRLLPSSTRVRTATGGVTPALGNLPIIIDVNGRCEKIEFRTVAELENELILGMDFFKLFDVDL